MINLLTRRERDVLALALSGLPNSEISTRLNITQRTVENHRANIHSKTGVNSLLKFSHTIAVAGLSIHDIALTEKAFV
jgi:DNA-binding CsgD family transcriptional regulator